MIVLVEGVDGSGKTTLCKELYEQGYTIGYNAYDMYNNFERFEHWSKMRNSTNIYILDRSFITDLVYRCVDGNTPRDMNLWEMLILVSEDCKIIHCKSPSAFEDSMSRGEDNITNKSLSDKISYAYDIILSMLKIYAHAKIMTYNWHNQNVNDVIKFIERR